MIVLITENFCCAIRKVHPMNKMLKTLDGWITGLRNDQNQNRSGAKMLELIKCMMIL